MAVTAMSEVKSSEQAEGPSKEEGTVLGTSTAKFNVGLDETDIDDDSEPLDLAHL